MTRSGSGSSGTVTFHYVCISVIYNNSLDTWEHVVCAGLAISHIETECLEYYVNLSSRAFSCKVEAENDSAATLGILRQTVKYVRIVLVGYTLIQDEDVVILLLRLSV